MTFATPGYYYALSYCMATLALLFTHRLRYQIKRTIPLTLILFTALTIFMIGTDGKSRSLFLLFMGIIFGILYLTQYLLFDYNCFQAGFFTAIVFSCGEFTASFAWLIYYYLSDHYQWETRWWKELLFLLLIGGCLSFLFFHMERRLNEGNMEIRVTQKELIIAIFIIIAAFTTSNLSFLSSDTVLSSTIAKDVFIIRSLVDMCGLVIFYAYRLQIREMHALFEKSTLHNMMQMQYQNYQLSQDSIDIVNRKYHDLKHQIILLREGIDDSKAKAYLDQMEKEVRVFENKSETGNEILDAVLTSKSIHCQNQQIELKYMVDGKLMNFMQDMDICALFGNMLDNAIESAEKQPIPEKRLVWLYVQKEKGFVCIRTENYCEEKVHFLNGLPITTKKDKDMHGFGVMSIRNTVEKYGGSVVAKQENNWFRLNILIPLK